MEKIDTRFNLRGKNGETITVTVNGNSSVPGVMCVVGTSTVDGSFKLDKATPVVFLAVNIDFNQAVGDTFNVTVTGDAPASFVSDFPVPRAGAFRTVRYRIETA
jgi:hypothetical protein